MSSGHGHSLSLAWGITGKGQAGRPPPQPPHPTSFPVPPSFSPPPFVLRSVSGCVFAYLSEFCLLRWSDSEAALFMWKPKLASPALFGPPREGSLVRVGYLRYLSLPL